MLAVLLGRNVVLYSCCADVDDQNELLTAKLEGPVCCHEIVRALSFHCCWHFFQADRARRRGMDEYVFVLESTAAETYLRGAAIYTYIGAAIYIHIS